MREVVLPGGVRTSAVGFGCSGLVGGKTARERDRVLDAAVDSGIRHFDVARMYGSGDAEAVLGGWVRARGAEVTITTKFGLDPMSPSVYVTALKNVVRAATRRSDRLLRFARRQGVRTVRRGSFAPASARESLQTSLSQLGREYVDVYLLHGCSPAEWHQEELLAVLDELVREGRIRSFGTGTSFAETQELLERPGRPPPVAQFEADALGENPSRVASESVVPIIHSVFRHALEDVRDLLEKDSAEAASWSEQLGVAVTAAGTLASLVLCHALVSNPTGIVLFSSDDANRIAQNAAVATEMPYDAEQLATFARLVRERLAAPPASSS